jgi:Squalene-hopene cyclase C-terminal domain
LLPELIEFRDGLPVYKLQDDRIMIRSNISKIARSARSVLRPLALSDPAEAELRRDAQGLPTHDPGIDRAIDEGVAWLARAQDRSASADGGVARHHSLIDGWGRSYPETTGYIVPTMLAYARRRGNDEVRDRAKRMLDWLVSLQLPDGGFQGGSVGRLTLDAVTFNTGQILIGLADGAREFGEYRESMCRAADWLVKTQDADGCWRKYPTPFAAPGEKTYETHVAWGLLDAARVEPQRGYAEAALANVRWALTHQRNDGWFEDCCLKDPTQPLTHTLGYALRGVVEAYRFTKDDFFLHAARKTADGLISAMSDDGFLPGRLRADWSGAVDWVCLTGTVQIASCWLTLSQLTRERRYRDAAYSANRYVRCTMKTDGPPNTRGGIKGSFPVSGGYGAYQYLNWACKFFVDSNMHEREVRDRDEG